MLYWKYEFFLIVFHFYLYYVMNRLVLNGASNLQIANQILSSLIDMIGTERNQSIHHYVQGEK